MGSRAGNDLLHGTVELLVLKLLEREPMNGYAIGQRIRSLTGDALVVDEGSLYPALYRMERRGLLASSWGRSENNRRAKFYRLTRAGRKQLGAELGAWTDFTEAVQKILESA
jgi:PadR family transcriptional regulator PadR